MQTAALRDLGLGDEWSYEAIEVAPGDFERLVRGMEAEGFAGANVTVPHKLAALAIADSASRAASEIGAANTLSFADGRIAADNTDASGILDALPISPRGRRALVLGAGGSARAAIWALAGAGAEVCVWNRTSERAAQARRRARRLGGRARSGHGQPAPGALRPDRQRDHRRPEWRRPARRRPKGAPPR